MSNLENTKKKDGSNKAIVIFIQFTLIFTVFIFAMSRDSKAKRLVYKDQFGNEITPSQFTEIMHNAKMYKRLFNTVKDDYKKQARYVSKLEKRLNIN